MDNATKMLYVLSVPNGPKLLKLALRWGAKLTIGKERVA